MKTKLGKTKKYRVQNMNKLVIYAIAIGILTACGNHTSQTVSKTKAPSQPNIVFVITDDQGYGDLSGTGNPIVKTPHIDKLAEESVNLTDYHVAPTCSPTRGALLTGHWTNRTGVWHTIMGRSMLRENETTIADLLKANGYHTAMFGKWHLGDNFPYRPMDRGFDLAYYHGGGGVGQTPDYWDNAYFDGSYFRNGVAEQAKGFVTDVFFGEAIKFIDSVKSSNQPFFVYLSTNAPHSPMHAPEEYAAPYEKHKLNKRLQHFFGMITNIDDNVAKLRNYLETQNLSDNTIFIYTTDNGTSAGEKVFNAGMRGKKGSQYDGGHRVPFFMHWPAGGYDQKVNIDTITSYVDIVPTLLDYTGAKAPNALTFDGVSLRPLIDGQDSDWQDRILITDSQRVLDPIKWRKSAVMTDEWRLIDGIELYNIKNDPSQIVNIAKKHPSVVKRLRAFYEAWWAELEPTFGEPTAIYLGDDRANPVELNSMDWLGHNKEVPWNQMHIRTQLREKDGIHKGFWWVNVVEEGDYIIELRRWPKETDIAVATDIASAPPVPGERSMRSWPGLGFDAVEASVNIGDYQEKRSMNGKEKFVRFNAHLKAGKGKLAAAFTNKNGEQLGAYFVTVTKR